MSLVRHLRSLGVNEVHVDGGLDIPKRIFDIPAQRILGIPPLAFLSERARQERDPHRSRGVRGAGMADSHLPTSLPSLILTEAPALD